MQIINPENNPSWKNLESKGKKDLPYFLSSQFALYHSIIYGNIIASDAII